MQKGMTILLRSRTLVGCIIFGTVLNFLWSSMQKGGTILFMEK